MYAFAVYFDGPRSQWGDELHEAEIIHKGEVPYLWLARCLARSHLGNTGRCSYLITKDGKTVEQYPEEE